MEQRLYEAAVEGSVTSLLELVQQDRLIFDRVIVNCYSETPLHVAAMLGHVDFVKQILHRKPELARELDSHRSSPLHLASAKGHLEVVKALLAINSEMCLACDRYGRNPLHLAAMKGRGDVLRALVEAKPRAALVKVDRSETILHLCVKQNEFEALKLLIEALNDHELVNAKDDDGNTILHLAVADKQIETIKFLLLNTRVEVNAVNANGLTALDILTRSGRDVKDLVIEEALQSAGALRATGISSSTTEFGSTSAFRSIRSRSLPLVVNDQFMPHPMRGRRVQKSIKKENWLSRRKDALMVVASLIATMAFQAGVNPPGGSWQVNSEHQRKDYNDFLLYNTVGFVASLSVIILLVSSEPFNHRLFMYILAVIMWVAITSMAVTYTISIDVLTPKHQHETSTKIIKNAVHAWCGVIGLLLLGHAIHLLSVLATKFGRFIWRERRLPSLEHINHNDMSMP